MMKNRFLFLALAACLPAASAQQAEPIRAEPQTRAESSGFTETTRHSECIAFVDALLESPAAPLRKFEFGKTTDGKAMVAVAAGQNLGADSFEQLARRTRSTDQLRIVINGNIHGGEVEGKEASLIILRELAQGQHADLLRQAVLVFVPDFNADGNDKINRRNRVSQNGPTGGVGARPNGQGLDLNRDFIKARSPEVQGMLGLFRSFDPHLFMDLHTTNGSEHGYHLTYAPSLAVNVDSKIDSLTRNLLAAVRGRMQATHGFRVFDYGNFRNRTRPHERWVTYDHRPRFGTNYVGLRNRLSILSEAYSYMPFETRVRTTRAFVLECLRGAVERADAVREACAAADARAQAGLEGFGYASRLADPVEQAVLVGRNERKLIEGLGTRFMATGRHEPVTMATQVAFTADKQLPLPKGGWLIVNPSDDVAEVLALHGVRSVRLGSEAKVAAQVFVPRRLRFGRKFQGVRPLSLTGEFRAESRDVTARDLWVPVEQPLVRVAAQLLEARSEDSLATWGFFDAQTSAEPEGEEPTGRLHYPVLRVDDLGALSFRRKTAGGALRLVVARAAPQPDAVVRYRIGMRWFDKISALRSELVKLRKDPAVGAAQLAIAVGNGTVYGDVARCVDAAAAAGWDDIVFVDQPSGGKKK